MVPLIPGITATQENLFAIADLLCKAGAGEVSLLPYNPMGMEMAVSLGRSKPPLLERFMKYDEEVEIRDMFKKTLNKKETALGLQQNQIATHF